MPYFLRTFGHPSLSSEGSEIRLIPKVLALLLYLRVTGQPQGRASIGQLLWSNIRVGQNHSVNNALSVLRGHLASEIIPPGADPVKLGSGVASETDLLDSAVLRGGGEAVLQALEAYRAPFLEGFELQLGEGAEPFVEWVRERRAQYDGALAQALEEYCAAEATAGRWSNVRQAATLGRERVSSWQRGETWLETANKRLTVPRRGSWILAGTTLLALTLVAALVWGRTPAPVNECAAGDARAHLVRQTYPAEGNLAIDHGRQYTPTWYLKNVGGCAWSLGAQLERVRSFGDVPLSADGSLPISTEIVRPDSIVQVTVSVRAPQLPGHYGEDWVLLDKYGQRIAIAGDSLLRLRFQVLPPDIPICRPREVQAELLAQSHPERDNRVVVGEVLTTSWTLVNRGSCRWGTDLRLDFHSASDARLSAPALHSVAIEEPVRPTEAYTFEIPVRIPRAPGAYRESWRLTDAEGQAIPVSDAPTVDVRFVASEKSRAVPQPSYCSPGEVVITWLGSERVADGSIVARGASVPKAWTLFNRGTCTWSAGSLRLRHAFSKPEFPAVWQESILDRDVAPRGTYTFRAPFAAPLETGRYEIHWSIINERGDVVIISRTPTIWADIKVVDDQEGSVRPSSF